MQKSSKTIRFINLILDILVIKYLFNFVVDYILLSIDPLIFERQSNLQGFLFEKWICCIFIYYALCEYLTGRTIGKLITGTHVISNNGTRPKLLNILIRSFLRLIPLEALTFLGNNGLHDSGSDTIVVSSDLAYIKHNEDQSISLIKKIRKKIPHDDRRSKSAEVKEQKKIKLEINEKSMIIALSIILIINIVLVLNKTYIIERQPPYSNSIFDDRYQYQLYIQSLDKDYRPMAVSDTMIKYFGLLPSWSMYFIYIGYFIVVPCILFTYLNKPGKGQLFIKALNN
jgi:uncharacterized RDD family membrane protein YckC